MQRFLVVVILLAAVAVGVGFYTGYFRLGTDNLDGGSTISRIDPK